MTVVDPTMPAVIEAGVTSIATARYQTTDAMLCFASTEAGMVWQLTQQSAPINTMFTTPADVFSIYRA